MKTSFPIKKKASVKTINVEPNWVGMFDAAIANARSNKDNLGVEMLDFGKRLYIQIKSDGGAPKC